MIVGCRNTEDDDSIATGVSSTVVALMDANGSSGAGAVVVVDTIG